MYWLIFTIIIILWQYIAVRIDKTLNKNIHRPTDILDLSIKIANKF